MIYQERTVCCIWGTENSVTIFAYLVHSIEIQGIKTIIGYLNMKLSLRLLFNDILALKTNIQLWPEPNRCHLLDDIVKLIILKT